MTSKCIWLHAILIITATSLFAQWGQTNGPGSGTVMCLAMQGTNVLAGNNAGLYHTADNGVTWTTLNNNFPTGVTTIATIDSNIFVGTGFGVYKSTDNGSSWSPDTVGLPFNFGQIVIRSLFISDSIIFAGVEGNGVYKKNVNAINWSSANTGILNVSTTFINQFIESGNIIFAGDDYLGRVYKTVNRGANWTLSNAGIPSNAQITALAANGSSIYAGSRHNQGILISNNQGNSWTSFNSGLPSNVQISSLTSVGSCVFAGTFNYGVYLLLDGDSIWNNVNSGLTNTQVFSLLNGNGFIFAGGWDGISNTKVSKRLLSDFLPSQPGIPSGQNNVCAGASNSYTTSGATLATSYAWSISPSSAGTILNSGLSATVFWNATFVGSANLKVQGVNCFGSGVFSNSYTISISALPSVTVTPSGSTTFCQGNSVVLTSSLASSYVWSNGFTTRNITVSTSGNYSVTITDANGCTASSSATTVVVNSLPTATITPSGATTFCQGSSVTLSASTASSYSWSNGMTAQNITVTNSSSYSVTVTNANGCSASSPAITVVVNPLPTATVTASGATTFCQGNSVTLSASASSSYSWSNGITTQSITVTNSDSYSVTVTNANGCSASSSATTVVVNPLPTAIITASGATTFCQGDSVSLSSSAANNYSWSNGRTTQSITVSSSGNYSVTVTNANGCSAAASAITITVNPLPAKPTISASSATLTSSSQTGNQWYLNGSLITGATSQTYTATQNGDYTVQVTDNNGCSAMSDAHNVTGVGINELDVLVRVYPNPTRKSIVIEFPLNTSQIRILNSVGQVIQSEVISGKTGFNFSLTENGIYFVQVEVGEQSIIKKVTVSK